MPASRFEAAVRRSNGAAIIDLRGDINALAGPALDAAYEEAVLLGSERMLLNFGEVEYINSTGIALIVGLLARARATGRPVLAFGLDDHYREIFTITRLSDFMPVFPDEASAVGGHPTATV